MILFFLIAVFVSQCVYYYPNLPPEMASHFGAHGEPNGWMPKEFYFVFMAFVLGVIVFQFAFLPNVIEKMPLSLINMPNKEFWFSDEKRTETIGIIRNFFEWFSAALLGLFIGINQLAIGANLNGGNLSLQSRLIIGAFVIFVIVWTIKLYRQFKLKP